MIQFDIGIVLAGFGAGFLGAGFDFKEFVNSI